MRPISVAAAYLDDHSLPTGLPYNLEALVAGTHAPEMMVQNGQNVMALSDVDSVRLGAGPLKGSAGPGPDVVVGVRDGVLLLGYAHGRRGYTGALEVRSDRGT